VVLGPGFLFESRSGGGLMMGPLAAWKSGVPGSGCECRGACGALGLVVS
jgi:hypothetical protein